MRQNKTRCIDEGHDSSVSKLRFQKAESWKSPQTGHDSKQQERLQMLYLLKSGQVASRQGLAELIGRDQATITMAEKYKDGGLKGLLEVHRVKLLSSVGQPWNGSLRLQEPQGFLAMVKSTMARYRVGLDIAYKRSMNSFVIDSMAQKSRDLEA